jgi:hypothetical protein
MIVEMWHEGSIFVNPQGFWIAGAEKLGKNRDVTEVGIPCSSEMQRIPAW